MTEGEKYSTIDASLHSNQADPEANLFSKLDIVQTFMTPDNKFHFMLLYPELGFKYGAEGFVFACVNDASPANFLH